MSLYYVWWKGRLRACTDISPWVSLASSDFAKPAAKPPVGLDCPHWQCQFYCFTSMVLLGAHAMSVLLTIRQSGSHLSIHSYTSACLSISYWFTHRPTHPLFIGALSTTCVRKEVGNGPFRKASVLSQVSYQLSTWSTVRHRVVGYNTISILGYIQLSTYAGVLKECQDRHCNALIGKEYPRVRRNSKR